jgi:hypothetical protein
MSELMHVLATLASHEPPARAFAGIIVTTDITEKANAHTRLKPFRLRIFSPTLPRAPLERDRLSLHVGAPVTREGP